MSNEPSVQIGIKEVYDKLCAVEDKVLALSPLSETMKDHELRMRTLERLIDSLQAAQKSVERFKSMVYPIVVAIIGIIITLVISMQHH
jgi:type II secretory pathway component PulF